MEFTLKIINEAVDEMILTSTQETTQETTQEKIMVCHFSKSMNFRQKTISSSI